MGIFRVRISGDGISSGRNSRYGNLLGCNFQLIQPGTSTLRVFNEIMRQYFPKREITWKIGSFFKVFR